MRVLVIGMGEVGQNIARTLSSQRHEVTAVDSDPKQMEIVQDSLDVLAEVGNGASPKFLADIGAGSMDLLCAVTQSDEANVIAALAGHQLGAGRTVARVRDEDYFGSDETFAKQVLGVDFVIQPESATAEHLADAVILPGAVQVEHFADGRISVAETIASDRSPLLDIPLRDRRMWPPHTIMGLIRDGRTITAEPGHRIQAGDHVLVAAAHEDIGDVVSHIAGDTVDVRDVIIFGAGRIGYSLARRLLAVSDLRVTLMERDMERARFVAEQISGATILQEEGVGEDALMAHGVDHAGAFVACAGDDRANLLAALHAKRVGASLSMAVVSREEFVPLVNALNIDAAVSPRLVTAEAILRSIRGEHVQAMRLLLGGAEVLEVEVESGCRAENLPIEEAGAMGHTHVGAIARGDQIIMPDAKERLRAGDRILVFSPRQGLSDVRGTFQAE